MANFLSSVWSTTPRTPRLIPNEATARKWLPQGLVSFADGQCYKMQANKQFWSGEKNEKKKRCNGRDYMYIRELPYLINPASVMTPISYE